MKFLPKTYLYFFFFVIPIWLWYMLTHNGFALYAQNWMAPVTMIFGAFIAGASSEGGGAVAFPVFTLLMDVPAATARNFSFACQSIGMTAASMLIIGMKIPVSWRVIIYTSIGGVVGLLLSTFYLVPLLPGSATKIFFVSLWFSFGFALYLTNKNEKREVYQELQSFGQTDIIRIVFFGFVGGAITAFFGNGIDIFTFCLFTLYYRISEKVATPTSVIIMTINTIIGFFLHVFIIKDFQEQAFHFWLCSVPPCIIFAPFGAYVISFFTRHAIAKLLYVIIVVQYIGALLVLRPALSQLLASGAVVVVGFLFFNWIAKLSKN
jgi:uncharacterized membrane protein YfcA